MTCRCTRTMNPWWSVNRPVNAAVSCSVLFRRLILARAASTVGFRSPTTNACSMARPDTPRMSLATQDSLIPASVRHEALLFEWR